MPALNQHLARGGTRLTNFLVSTGVCCPARVSALSGKLAHCTNVTGNWYPSGAFRKFYERKVDDSWLPGWLQSAGYNTYLVGKFLNAYLQDANFMRQADRGAYYPKGWTLFDALTQGTYSLMNSCFATNGAPNKCFPGQYQTDIIRDKALGYLNEAVAAKKPFFMYVAPTAPHVETAAAGWKPPTPAARHANLYANDKVSIPRGDNWGVVNPSIPIEPDSMGADAIADMEALYLNRLRSLRAVDELLDSLVKRLSSLGQLDNTYVIYTSDNGIHMGQFSQSDGKALGIEEDTRLPFFIRGPGIPAGQQVPTMSNLVDIAPTIMTLAGLPYPTDVDGMPLPASPALAAAHVTELQAATDNGQGSPVAVTSDMYSWWRRDTNILEAWDSDGSAATQNVVFKTLRVCTDFKIFPDSGSNPSGLAARQVYAPGTACYKYTIWCLGQKEFYDLSTDPYEVKNRLGEVPQRVVDRLDAVLSALAHCKGNSCQSPYSILHPGLNVLNFTATMSTSYDTMYRRLVKFKYNKCRGSYVIANEPAWSLGIGPQPSSFVGR
ncbi:hypothetical protein GPECTOR_16g631 [Gonium pectorale]|uniref:Sulfatase N-terminal domain-containing protein n=1 Tax=Gonium pectorale TaxID=33097 RepID=A0A150GKZ2_GONPE|nr:hypothetical protein GPECTOR_16g631 [Gonium pectorale]|eukprot:KXZ50457.1 hypothetical protein GPECTOR_16g631 [Gonium pectorale]